VKEPRVPPSPHWGEGWGEGIVKITVMAPLTRAAPRLARRDLSPGGRGGAWGDSAENPIGSRFWQGQGVGDGGGNERLPRNEQKRQEVEIGGRVEQKPDHGAGGDDWKRRLHAPERWSGKA